MKKLKIKFLKKYSALIAAVVGLFSSSSCSMVQPVEYGTPSARYVVDGKVTDNGTGKPIENIRVLLFKTASIKRKNHTFYKYPSLHMQKIMPTIAYRVHK